MLTFRKIGYIAAVAAAGVLGASAASAATYNFEAVAGVTEQGVVDGTVVNAGGGLASVAGFGFDGTTIIDKSNFAYFDGVSGGLPAGVGVCGTLNDGNQCAPSSDDNITVGEALGINFGDGVLTSVTFRGKELGDDDTSSHELLAAKSSFLFSLDGVVFQQGFVGAGGVWDAGNLNLLNANGIFFAIDGYELYVAEAEFEGGPPDGGPNPVPLPAGGLLLLTALGGLGVARKRAKKS